MRGIPCVLLLVMATACAAAPRADLPGFGSEFRLVSINGAPLPTFAPISTVASGSEPVDLLGGALVFDPDGTYREIWYIRKMDEAGERASHMLDGRYVRTSATAIRLRTLLPSTSAEVAGSALVWRFKSDLAYTYERVK
jgi:hypothetical protein